MRHALPRFSVRFLSIPENPEAAQSVLLAYEGEGPVSDEALASIDAKLGNQWSRTESRAYVALVRNLYERGRVARSQLDRVEIRMEAEGRAREGFNQTIRALYARSDTKRILGVTIGILGPLLALGPGAPFVASVVLTCLGHEWAAKRTEKKLDQLEAQWGINAHEDEIAALEAKMEKRRGRACDPAKIANAVDRARARDEARAVPFAPPF